MKRLFLFAISAGLATMGEAQVQGGIADVAVIDRDSGAVLSPHFFHGEYWVAGRPGARYAIEIRNRLGERVLAVTSVDGVNVVSGDTAAWDQTGYVFEPGERYQITGWRKTDAQVAAFTFTESPNSYAERTGRPANVGVIGVALFRERQPQPMYAPPTIGQSSGRAQAPRAAEFDSNSTATAGAKASPMMPAPWATPAPSAVPAPSAMQAPSAMSESSAMSAPLTSSIPRAAAVAPKLGTGHGEREYSYVNHTDFQRLQSQPNEVIRIRYDSLDNLFAMGIIKRPRPAPPGANPFPASPEQQYVPDPQG